jgi:microsomal dipeptidase-like Zn-dependent dipeptidase
VTHDSLCLVAAAPSVTPWSLRGDHEELVAGGVDAVFATVASLEDTAAAVTRVGQWLGVHDDPRHPAHVATSTAEIVAAKAAGETAVVPHFQGSEPFGGDAGLVGGVRAAGCPGDAVDLQLPHPGRGRLLRAGERRAEPLRRDAGRPDERASRRGG